MKISRIEFRNIASYGNNTQIIDFNDSNSFYLVMGENGSGKSSISHIIKLGLYGKSGSTGIRSGKDIANRINGNGYIKIEFESKGKNIIIERFFNPDKVPNIIIDGVDQRNFLEAGKRNIDQYVENELLEFPFYIFNNLITLSINDFKSLVKMSKQDKALIFDRIFGFYVINEMRKLISAKIRIEKDSLESIEHTIAAISKSIERSKAELENLTKKIDEDNSLRVEEIRAQIENLKEKRLSLKEQLAQTQNNTLDLKKQYELLQKQNIDIQFSIRELNKKMKLYQNDKCPECGSSLCTEQHNFEKESLENKLNSAKEKELSVSESLKNVNELINKNNGINLNINKSIGDVEFTLKGLIAQLKELMEVGNTPQQLESINKIVESLENDAAESSKKKKMNELRFNYLKLLDDILGERGVKSEMVKSILPMLNNEIAKISDQLGLDYTIMFDETFDSSIYQLGYKISPYTLSTGEMKKTDFVTLIAVIKLMKIKYSAFNVMFLDEIFSSLDPNSIQSVLYILRNVCKELGINIFVINHSQLPLEVFDHIINVQKINGFSQLSITN